jgi:hypothetical protein
MQAGYKPAPRSRPQLPLEHARRHQRRLSLELDPQPDVPDRHVHPRDDDTGSAAIVAVTVVAVFLLRIVVQKW